MSGPVFTEEGARHRIETLLAERAQADAEIEQLRAQLARERELLTSACAERDRLGKQIAEDREAHSERVERLRAELAGLKEKHDGDWAHFVRQRKIFNEGYDEALAHMKSLMEIDHASERDVLASRVERLEKSLERISRPLDCGCVPCVGQCRTEDALQIYLDEIKDAARAALNPEGSEHAKED